MRTVTFSSPNVAERLNRDFVCAWKNIRPEEPFADPRRESEPGSLAAGTGDANICAVVATPEGLIVHALPGFRGEDELMAELDFALHCSQVGPEADLAALYAERRSRFTGDGASQGDRLLAASLAQLAETPRMPLLSIRARSRAGVLPEPAVKTPTASSAP